MAKHNSSLERLANVFKVVLVIALFSSLFGLGDGMETNWDHTMHMSTIEKSTLTEINGWKGYGVGYYKLSVLARDFLEPLNSILNSLVTKTEGLKSAAIFVNLSCLVFFILVLRKLLLTTSEQKINLFLAAISTPFFYWTLRVYPDVALAGLVGISLVLQIKYLSTGKLFFVGLAGLLVALSLHVKQTTVLLLPLFFLIFLLRRDWFQNGLVYAVVVASVYVLIGFPGDYQAVDWVVKTLSSDNEWIEKNSLPFTNEWAFEFSKNAFLVAIIPAVPFLFTNSRLFSEEFSLKNARYSIIVVFLLYFVSIFSFFISRPLAVVTQHYMVLCLPLMCIALLMIPFPKKYCGAATLFTTCFFLALLYITDWKYPLAFANKKGEELSCIASWEQAIQLLPSNYIRTPYLPFRYQEGQFFYLPTKLVTTLENLEGPSVMIASSYWLKRFRDEKNIERYYSQAIAKLDVGERKLSDERQGIESSLELLSKISKIEQAGQSFISNGFRVETLMTNVDCKVQVVQFDPVERVSSIPLSVRK